MDLEYKLIELVKSYEYLYNIKADYYKDSLKKEDTWNRIGGELNTTGEICRKKFKSLRDTYKKVKQRRAQQPHSGVPEKIRLWKYEEQLRFLDDLAPRRTLSKPFELPENEGVLDDCNVPVRNEIIDSDSVSYVNSPPSAKKQKVENSFPTRLIESAIENLLDDSSLGSDEPLSSNSVSYNNSSIPQKKHNLDIAMLYEKFEIFLESASTSVAELQQKSTNPTILLFESMGKKIAAADITEEQKSDIEHSVCMLVFTKLAKFRSEKTEVKKEIV